MLIEEMTASTKVCPMAMRMPVEITQKHCRGFECMEWRKHGNEGEGYCGLAGRPDGADAQVEATRYMLKVVPLLLARAGIDVSGVAE